MKKAKPIERMFNEINIKFILNPKHGNLMVNATEIAKHYNRRIDHFRRSDDTQRFISAMKKLPKDESLWSEFTPTGGNWGENVDENRGQFPPNGVNSDAFFLTDDDIYQPRGHQGTWMHRLLALKFAAWLDAEFELWIYLTIDNILFGHYKKHWEAHAVQEEAKQKMEILKNKLLTKGGTAETVAEYFENENISRAASVLKRNAIAGQLKLFSDLER